MHQNLLNAEFAFVEYLNVGDIRARYPGHESAHKGVAQELLLYICLPSIALFG
jgi:hypothetical protein